MVRLMSQKWLFCSAFSEAAGRRAPESSDLSRSQQLGYSGYHLANEGRVFKDPLQIEQFTATGSGRAEQTQDLHILSQQHAGSVHRASRIFMLLPMGIC